MQYLLVIISLWATEVPNPILEVARGSIDEFPNEWVSIQDIDDVPVGNSYWVKVTIDSKERDQLSLQGGNWYMQNIHFYDSQLELLHIGNALNVDVISESQNYYLFYPFHDEKDPGFFSISLSKKEDFLIKKYEKNVFQSVFNSILIFVLAVCTFFIFGSSSRIYSNYIIYISSILVFFTYQYGILGTFIPIVNHIPPTWMWILSASISFTYTLFSRSFLDMKTMDPFNYKVSTYGLYFIMLIVLTESSARILSYDILHQVWYKAIILIIEFAFMIVFVYRIAMMKTLISSIFLIGAFILLLSSLTGQVASTFKIAYETNRFVQIGLLLDVFILSIGIAVRVNVIQRERRDAQQRLIEQLTVNEGLQKAYLKKLELEVEQRTSDLAKRNTENETLLKEVHHRVKNNLQMVTSLLSMQQRRLSNNAAIEALSLTKNRVRTIGMIHEHLYRHEDFSKINLYDYVWELSLMIKNSSAGQLDQNKLNIDFDVPEKMTRIDDAIVIGIILNEILTNSFKHAFEKVKDPKISIRIKEVDDQLQIIVSDNGPGPNSNSSDEGFGKTIISALLENCNGTYESTIDENGYHVFISLGELSLLNNASENS